MVARSSKLGRAVLLLGAVCLAFGLLEVGVRVFGSEEESLGLHKICLDRPYLYGLEPLHPEVSSQGLRHDEVSASVPPGESRVLVLGDSVTYGVGLSRDAAIPAQIDALLDHVEVINAGVHGYTPFNELHYYREEGRRFGARTVVVVFCLNDVADPHLHWRFAAGLRDSIPAAAVPDMDYHRIHSRAVLQEQFGAWQRKREWPWAMLRRSALVREVWQLFEAGVDYPTRVVDGRAWPVHLTGDDTQSIEVLMDYESSAWNWLRGMYRELRDAVQADGAKLVVASVPLAYQLDADYPFLPQDLLARCCAELEVDYVRTLEALRRLDAEQAFLSSRSEYDDIWHLAEEGARVVAEAIAEKL